MNIGRICSRPPVTVAASATLGDAARLMRDRHVGAVVVTEAPSERPVAIGMLTDRDIVNAQLDRTADLTRVRVADVMSTDPLMVGEDDPIGTALERMSSRGVRRAPVLGPHGSLVGVVSTDDILTQVARELGALARLLQRQPGREDT